MYRIISGKWKGRRVSAPKDFDVRPTTDFAKEALFSIVGHRFDIPFISALDLFAGIGSITLELASRNCKDITSIEQNAKHCAFINGIAKDLEVDSQINVQRSDVFVWLDKNKESEKHYNLIFADPPFDLEKEKYIELIDLVLNNNYLAENGIFILEHKSRQIPEHPNIVETRKYGNVSFSFIESDANRDN